MRIAPVLLAAALAALLAASADAQALLRYSWGADASVVVDNQDWIGPTTYSQNLSVTGLSGTFDRISVYVSGPWLPDAWRPLQYFTFSSYGSSEGTDCLGMPATTVSASVPGAETIPGAVLGAYAFPGITTPRTSWQYIVDISPPMVADPSKRYGLALVQCDLQHAATGYVIGACLGADYPLCLRVEAAAAHPAGQPPSAFVPIMLGVDDVIRWQDSAGMLTCLSTTPTRSSTWGSLKSRHR